MSNTEVSKVPTLAEINAMPESNIAEMKAKLAAMEAYNDSLSKAIKNTLQIKLYESGAIGILGLQRFPVSLHPSQWARLIAFAPEISKYLEANKDKLVWERPAKTEKAAEEYSEEQYRADLTVLTDPKATAEQKQFATTRLDKHSRFGKK